MASRRHSPGRQALVATYAVFAVAAGARSAVQIITRFDQAPVAYLLSALSALVYLVATLALRRTGRGAYALAVSAIGVELVGVLGIGALSLLVPEWFPDQTVWSHFGQGYLFIPLVLPVVGLWWLRRHGRGGGATR